MTRIIAQSATDADLREAVQPAVQRSRPAGRALDPATAHARSRARYVRRALAALLLLATLAAIALAWLPDPIPVEVAQATRGPLSVMVDEEGRTRVKDRYVISAPLPAQLSRIELEAGDAVAPGQMLARLVPLDPPLLDTRSRAQATARVAASAAARRQADVEVERARTALEFARRESERQRALGRSGASSARLTEQAELEEKTLSDALASAEFAARVASYELEMAQLALGRSSERGERPDQIEVVSPIRGHVLRVIQESAGVVQPAAPLLELGDLSALEVVADVLTSDAVHIHEGEPAFIGRWGDERVLGAHVRRVEPSAFSRISTLGVQEQRVNVILDLDADRSQWRSLGDGYRVEVRIETWRGRDVLSVPASAVFRYEDRWMTFVVEDGKARLVPLQLGRRSSDRVEVQRGLPAGAQVIMHASDRVHDGARVKRR